MNRKRVPSEPRLTAQGEIVSGLAVTLLFSFDSARVLSASATART